MKIMNSSLTASLQAFRDFIPEELSAIEEKVESKEEFTKNLHPKALYTSATDFAAIFASSFVVGDWVDLGSGLGLSVMMYAQAFPERRAYGIEGALARHEWALKKSKNFQLTNAFLSHDDLLTGSLPLGHTFFLYFPTGPVLDRILSELRVSPSFKRLVVIESHGDLIARINREPWLRKMGEIELSDPRHYSHAVVFEGVASDKETHEAHDLSFRDKVLLVVGSEGEWLGDSLGLTWLHDDTYNLLHPPRTIKWSQVKNVLDPRDLSSVLQFLVALRRQGGLRIHHRGHGCQGELRKIRISPSFALEISSGQWVEWSEITSIHSGDFLCYDSSSRLYSLPPARR